MNGLIRKWHVSSEVIQFEIANNNSARSWTFTNPKTSSYLSWWTLRFQTFNFIAGYRKYTLDFILDALSNKFNMANFYVASFLKLVYTKWVWKSDVLQKRNIKSPTVTSGKTVKKKDSWHTKDISKFSLVENCIYPLLTQLIPNSNRSNIYIKALVSWCEWVKSERQRWKILG